MLMFICSCAGGGAHARAQCVGVREKLASISIRHFLSLELVQRLEQKQLLSLSLSLSLS
eukprot:COSAG02_NODE_8992_length_2369_cov_24.416532_3_plen_58_part_01